MSLYIIATPIGNLEDITLRAIRLLKEVDFIACENIPRTRALLSHLEIKNKRLLEYSPANEKNSAEGIVKLLLSGLNGALVSDAGTPCISDPGLALVSTAVAFGITVSPIPGASALTALSCVSGLSGEALIFLGFLPKKEGQALQIITRYASKSTVLVIYESGRRVKKLLNLLKSCGVYADVTLGKELTKIHEGFLRGGIEEVASQLEDEEKGEYVLAVRFHDNVGMPEKEQGFSKKEKRRLKLQKRIDTGEVSYGD
ncbi:MAG: 16S rRNA (cytidine(1402)-2'-O)-methyltransferase [Brevinema sp.]